MFLLAVIKTEYPILVMIIRAIGNFNDETERDEEARFANCSRIYLGGRMCFHGDKTNMGRVKEEHCQ